MFRNDLHFIFNIRTTLLETLFRLELYHIVTKLIVGIIDIIISLKSTKPVTNDRLHFLILKNIRFENEYTEKG